MENIYRIWPFCSCTQKLTGQGYIINMYATTQSLNWARGSVRAMNSLNNFQNALASNFELFAL